MVSHFYRPSGTAVRTRNGKSTPLGARPVVLFRNVPRADYKMAHAQTNKGVGTHYVRDPKVRRAMSNEYD
jgi:hypothetical protein